jgi:hypothetical protein
MSGLSRSVNKKDLTEKINALQEELESLLADLNLRGEG